MEERDSLDRDYEVFSSKRFEDIIIFRFKENLLYRTTELGAKATVLSHDPRHSRGLAYSPIRAFNTGSPKGETTLIYQV